MTADRPRPNRWIFLLIPVLLVGGAAAWWFSPGQVQKRKDRAFKKAVAQGNVDTVTEQLARGANVNARYKDGLTPLMYAAKGDRPNPRRPRRSDHPEVVELLIQKGADPNAKTETGMTALFWAARYGHAGVTRVLLAHHADPNAKDGEGMTALKWAIENKETPVIDLLKKAGAKE